MSRLLTLLSDFGTQDAYVAVMKGTIAQIAPSVTVIDLTHEIPPQNIAAARFNLLNAYPYFPAGTVHVAVVDPGVGSQRRSIALQLPNGFLVGPDNGLFSGILSQQPALEGVELTNPAYWRTPLPSFTFHGRDIFAPVGAHLAIGVPLSELGEAIDLQSLAPFPLPPCTQTANHISGCIQHIDRFGNLITNIPDDRVRGKSWAIVANDQTIASQSTYADSAIGSLLALIGSHGWVEIAVNRGSAQAQLQLTWGSPIHLVLTATGNSSG